MKSSNATKVRNRLIQLHVVTVLSIFILMWVLEWLEQAFFTKQGMLPDYPLIIGVGQMTFYMFFFTGLSIFYMFYNQYLKFGITRKTIFRTYLIASFISICLYIALMAGGLWLSEIEMTSTMIIYYLTKLFFDCIVSFLLGSLLSFSHYKSKYLAFALFIPVLIGIVLQLYIWFGYLVIIDPHINGPALNLGGNAIASAVFAFLLYYAISKIVKTMPIKL